MEPYTASVDYITETTIEANTTGEAEVDIPLLAPRHFYFKAGLVVNNYYGLSLVVIGLIGNTLSLLVMLQVCENLQLLLLSHNKLHKTKYEIFKPLNLTVYGYVLHHVKSVLLHGLNPNHVP